MGILVQNRRSTKADKRFFRKLLRGLQYVPRAMVTGKPKSRAAGGTPVLARDCVASVRRWAKRDAMGGILMHATDELSAPDDRTIQFRLGKPFPLLPDALGKPASYMPAIPMTQVGEIVGSGPFRYVANERVQGTRNVHARFDGYKPREAARPTGSPARKLLATTASNGPRSFWNVRPA